MAIEQPVDMKYASRVPFLERSTLPTPRFCHTKVVVESDTKKMLKIVSFVYLIPVILFLAGYLIMLACNTSVAVQYTAAVAGAVLGILLAIWYDRRVKARGGLSFTIVRVF